MYHTVLVPLDQTGESEKVIERLPDLVAADGSALLLTIIPPGRTRTVSQLVVLGTQQEEEDTIRAMAYLRQVSKKLDEVSVKSTCWVTVQASAATGIIRFAKQQNADLISMYTRDRRGLAKLIRGNVAKEVVRDAPCPVMVLGSSDLAGARAAAEPAVEATAPAPSYAEVDLFRNLTSDQIGSVVALGSSLRIPAGKSLGEGGDMGEKLFLIKEGEARLTAHADIGEIVVRIAGPEESFPLAILLGEGSLITAGEALTDMELLEIPRAPLLELCSRDTQIGMGIYSAVAKLFANRYDATLNQLGISVARELHDETL